MGALEVRAGFAAYRTEREYRRLRAEVSRADPDRADQPRPAAPSAGPASADRPRPPIRYLVCTGVAEAGGVRAPATLAPAPAGLPPPPAARHAPSVARRFGPAWWALHPDGRLLFTPARGHGRGDVFPLAGWHEPDAGGWQVRAARAASPGVGAELRGSIGPASGGWRFDGHYAGRGAGRPVSMPVAADLVEASSRPDRIGVSLLDGVPVPLVFQVELAGLVGGSPFGPLPAELTVVDPVPGGRDPVEIMLAPPAADDGPVPVDLGALPGLGEIGEVLWLTSAPGLIAADTGACRITVRAGTLDCEVRGGDEASLGVTVNVPAPYIGAMPAPVTDARLVLRFTPLDAGTPTAAWRVDGRLTARATAMAGTPAGYDATLTGTARAATLDDLGPSAFERAWARAGAGGGLGEFGEFGGGLPAAGGPDPPGGATVPPDWRRDRDTAYDLVLAHDHAAAVPLLHRALAGCRAEQDHTTHDPLRHHAVLIDETNILTRLVACHRHGDDWAALIRPLRESLATYRRLAAVPYLTEVERAQAALVVANHTDAIEGWRRQLADELDRIELLDVSADVFEELADLFADLDRPDAALVAAERGRARTLADLLAGGPVEALTAAELRATVGGYGATVVEYLLGERRSWAWVVAPAGTVALVPLTITRGRAEALAGELLAALDPNGDPAAAGPRPPRPARDLLAALHDELVAPLAPDTLPADGAALAIVPHGALWTVPWAALRSAADAGGDRGRYLHERFAVCVLPSIGTLRAAGLSPAPPVSARGLLALLNPIPMPPTLPALPTVEAAGPALAGLFTPGTARTFAGRDATLARLRTALPAEVVVLGTHGVVDWANGAAGSLVLAAPAGTDDGRADLADLRTLSLDSPLVILLACRTGVGRITGDGVLAISRAFLLAGARCLASSLWWVGEDVGTEIVYRMLAIWRGGGTTRAQALRLAVAELAAEEPDNPQMWGAFQLTGAWS
ncbi:CHAT domain-containing protein [Frankia sp. AgB32]|uniref:CHAT domain-containing protein n=1 Tax=Frankia sp. AgB32 TaxID=631119 RepID=UPI00200E0677|nr:CHAT domain-containing protein [Frankia sp. AgB32]MCK9893671.1 CHAT domain-containing protein [Frankia sp. AgB32]